MNQENNATEVGVIQLANRLSELDRLHAFFEELGHRSSWAEKLKRDLTLSCEELLTNTISYGFPQGGEHIISLAVHAETGWIELRIEDAGIPFNPFDREDPDISLSVEERDIGGLGVFFVKRIMNEVRYERTNTGNRLILRKML